MSATARRTRAKATLQKVTEAATKAEPVKAEPATTEAADAAIEAEPTAEELSAIQALRDAAVVEILALKEEETEAIVGIGVVLNRVRGTFPKKAGKAFFAWVEEHVGMQQNAAYKYMRAANTANDSPEAVQATGGAVVSLAYLAGFDLDERKAILDEAEPNSAGVITEPALKAAAEKVIPAEAVKAETRRKKAEEKEVGTKVERDLATTRMYGKYRDEMIGLLNTAESYIPDPNALKAACTLACTIGEKVATVESPMYYRAFNRVVLEFFGLQVPEEKADDEAATAARLAEAEEDRKADEAAALATIEAAKAEKAAKAAKAA